MRQSRPEWPVGRSWPRSRAAHRRARPARAGTVATGRRSARLAGSRSGRGHGVGQDGHPQSAFGEPGNDVGRTRLQPYPPGQSPFIAGIVERSPDSGARWQSDQRVVDKLFEGDPPTPAPLGGPREPRRPACSSETTSESTPDGSSWEVPASARSSTPVRTPSISRSDESSRSEISISGYRRWNSGERVEEHRDGAGRDHADRHPAADQAGKLVRGPPGSAARRPAPPGRTAGSRHRRRWAGPCARLRSSNVWPSSRSSRRICALTPDWLTCTRAAARVKLRLLDHGYQVLQLTQLHALEPIRTASAHHQIQLLDF